MEPDVFRELLPPSGKASKDPEETRRSENFRNGHSCRPDRAAGCGWEDRRRPLRGLSPRFIRVSARSPSISGNESPLTVAEPSQTSSRCEAGIRALKAAA